MKDQAFSLYQAGQLPAAQQAFQQVCQLDPRDAESRMMLGVICAQLGALPLGVEHLRQATALAPDLPAAWSNLGLALMSINQLQEAEACLRKAIELNPKDVDALLNIGSLYRQLGQVDAAVASYEAAIRAQPRRAQAHNNLGSVLQGQCRNQEAIEAYRRALKLEPRYAQAAFNLGSVLQAEGQHDQARYQYEKALQLDPNMLEARAAIAGLHEKEGHYEAARDLLNPYLQGAQTPTSIALTYAAVARRLGELEAAHDLLQAVGRRPDLSLIDRQCLEFLLGDILDQDKRFDDAFEHYRRANEIRGYHYNKEANHRYFEQIKAAYPTSARVAPASNSDYPPVILIVGMPRSSTSLVEQILSSHPEVHGGGELPHIGNLVAELGNKKQAHYPAFSTHIDQQDINRLAQRYLKQLRAMNPKARFVTDKMPHNFLYLGLMARALPNVRIVHTMRNPLDTCLSIYFHNFNSNHPYSSDLRTLGEYYQDYVMLMAHWREVLGDQLLDMPYEDLIADQESQSRRLIEFCGLEWNEACLSFHKSKRIVNTPSYDQVRKPIYTSSRERWRNYERHLSPLIDVLGQPGAWKTATA